MNINNNSDEMIKNILNALNLNTKKNKQGIERLIVNINTSIRLIRKAGNSSKLEANLTTLEYCREYLKQYKNNIKNRQIIWKSVKSCFKDRIITGAIINLSIIDPKTFFKKPFRSFANKIKGALNKSLIKVNVILSAEFVLPSKGEISNKAFNTSNKVIDQTVNIKKVRRLPRKGYRLSVVEFTIIINLKVNINKYSTITGSVYIKLPQDLELKKAVVNVQNNDNYCFLWAIISAYTG